MSLEKVVDRRVVLNELGVLGQQPAGERAAIRHEYHARNRRRVANNKRVRRRVRVGQGEMAQFEHLAVLDQPGMDKRSVGMLVDRTVLCPRVWPIEKGRAPFV